MREQDWTKEPWHLSSITYGRHVTRTKYSIRDATEGIITNIYSYGLADMKRAIACVNACKNIPTESLEQAAATGVVAINGGTPVQLFRETKARLAEAERLLRDHVAITEDFDPVNWPAMLQWKRERDAFLNPTEAPS